MTKTNWLKEVLESGVPVTAVQGFFNMLGEVASSMTANPVAAAVGGVAILGIFKRVGLIDETIANAGIAAVLGMTVAEVAGNVAEQLIPNLPFAQAATDANSFPDNWSMVRNVTYVQGG